MARLVLEARRAIDDPPTQAALIVNVHGVGYRFAGQIQDGGVRASEDVDASLETVRDLLVEVEKAYEVHNDRARARQHAEKALSEALRHRLGVESGKAMCWLAWLAMWSGSTEEAARYLALAYHQAATEDHPLLLAQAQVVDAFMNLTIGNYGRVFDTLTEAHQTLVTSGSAGYLYRCQTLLMASAQILGDLELALQWVVRARATAVASGLHLYELKASMNHGALLLEFGRSHKSRDEACAARAIWLQGLAACDGVLAKVLPQQDAWLYTCSLGNRGALLTELGRFSDARDTFAAMKQCEQGMPEWGSPAHRERSHLTRVDLVRLAIAEGDLARAFDESQSAVQLAESCSTTGRSLPLIYEQAAGLAERMGQFAQALKWARLHHAAHVAQERERAKMVVRVFNAKTSHDFLQRELDLFRQRVIQLEAINSELLQSQRMSPSVSPTVNMITPLGLA